MNICLGEKGQFSSISMIKKKKEKKAVLWDYWWDVHLEAVLFLKNFSFNVSSNKLNADMCLVVINVLLTSQCGNVLNQHVNRADGVSDWCTIQASKDVQFCIINKMNVKLFRDIFWRQHTKTEQQSFKNGAFRHPPKIILYVVWGVVTKGNSTVSARKTKPEPI